MRGIVRPGTLFPKEGIGRMIERTSKHALFAAALAGLLVVSTRARADSIQISLSQSTLSGTAGSTLVFDATLTNLSTSTVFLNGDTSSTSSLLLTVNDNPFLNNAPLSLAAGASSGTFEIFDVIIAAGIAPGVYTLNDFTILGGVGGSDLTPVGSATFTVDVLSPVPEPGTLVLVGSGLIGLVIRHRKGMRKA